MLQKCALIFPRYLALRSTKTPKISRCSDLKKNIRTSTKIPGAPFSVHVHTTPTGRWLRLQTLKFVQRPVLVIHPAHSAAHVLSLSLERANSFYSSRYKFLKLTGLSKNQTLSTRSRKERVKFNYHADSGHVKPRTNWSSIFNSQRPSAPLS